MTEEIKKEEVETKAEKPNPVVEKPAEDFDYKSGYEELRKWNTRTAQQNTEIKGQLEEIKDSQKTMAKAMAAASEEDIDPEVFMKELTEKGPKAFNEYLEKREQGNLAQYAEAIHGQQNQIHQLNINAGIAERRNNPKYPNWNELEATMNELANDSKTPLNFENPDVTATLDGLYKLASQSLSPQQIEKAKADAAAKAEEDLAREAMSTTSTSGGKGKSTEVDFKSMSTAELKKYIAEKHGVDDR